MIITIDGPTASGKSTIAQLLAQQKEFMYINSGLLYRAVAYVLLHNKREISPHSHLAQAEVDELFPAITYTYSKDTGASILWKNENITHLLKTPEIDLAASIVAIQPLIRQEILEYERTLAHQFNVIADGRDCGTVIFPQAEYKFFITASLDVRADRWQRDQRKAGKEFSFDESKAIVEERDRRDSERSISPMVPADDALIIDTSSMTIQEVLSKLIAIIGTIEQIDPI